MNKTIALVENSKTLSHAICDALKEAQFDVQVLSDGLEALNYVLKNEVCCVVGNLYSPKIDGYEMASVIKDGIGNNHIPVILYHVGDTYLGNSYDETIAKLVSLESNDFEGLISFINSELESEKIRSMFFDDEEEKEKETDISVCAVKAMASKYTQVMVSNKVFDLEQFLQSIDSLSRQILETVYSICPFECASLILGQEPAKYFYSVRAGISESNRNDFFNICKSDYEGKLGLSNNIDYEFIEVNNIFPQQSKDEDEEINLKSIHSFDITGEFFAGTLIIASGKRKNFSYQLISTLDLFVRKLGNVVTHSMNYENLSVSKNRMYSAFTKFVPEEIIEEMIKNDDATDTSVTEKRKVAIMICDIRSFTTISEINEPENVVNFLNGYFTRMVDVIKKNGGSIDKFMGDAIMANFGAPISYSDNAKRAVDAAVEMLNVLEEVPVEMLTFNEKVPDIKIGVGIHYGEVIVGNIGCKDKTDYTVIGDSANLASRLEGLTKQYGASIIVSRDVLDGIEDAVKKDSNGVELKEVERKTRVQELMNSYNFVQMDKVKVKGKHQGIEIFSVNSPVYSETYKEEYEKGLSLYLKGNFSFAKEYFEKARLHCGGDKACDLMISICDEYRETPPDNWDGARELTSK